MRTIEKTNNFRIYKDFIRKLIVRAIVLAVTITVGVSTLAGCSGLDSFVKEPTGMETITPTDTISPEVTNTPTSTPMPVHKTLQEVKDELANVKVSVDELMNEDVVYPSYFGVIEDNITTEITKRTAYFESKGISYISAKLIVIALNYDYLTSDAVDREKADRFLEVLYKNNEKYKTTEMIRALTLVLRYNARNLNDQIVLGWGIIDNTDTRAIINNTQQQVMYLISSNSTFENEFMPTEKYDIKVTRKDGSSTQITGLYDDLSIAFKYMDAAIPVTVIYYLGVNRLTQTTMERLSNNMDIYFDAFEESRHANAK